MNQLTLILLFWPNQSLEPLRHMEEECRTPKRLNADILNSGSVNMVIAASTGITTKMICIWCNNNWCFSKCSNNSSNIISNSNKCRIKEAKISLLLRFPLTLPLHLQVAQVLQTRLLRRQILTPLKMIQMFNNILLLNS